MPKKRESHISLGLLGVFIECTLPEKIETLNFGEHLPSSFLFIVKILGSFEFCILKCVERSLTTYAVVFTLN